MMAGSAYAGHYILRSSSNAVLRGHRTQPNFSTCSEVCLLRMDVQNVEVPLLKRGAKNGLFLGGYIRTSRLKREHLSNETSYRQTKKKILTTKRLLN